jgi:hypothetical protein
MMNNNDILLNGDYDLLYKDGDFVTGDALIQQQALLLSTGEGEWKQSPVTGVGMPGYLNDESEAELFRKVRLQFRNDNLSVTTLKKQTDGTLLIKAQHA